MTLVLLIGFFIGLLVFMLSRHLTKRQVVNSARRFADDIIVEAEDRALELVDDAKRAFNEFKDEAYEKLETEIIPIQDRIARLKDKFADKKSDKEQSYNDSHSHFKRKLNYIKQEEERFNSKKQSYMDNLDLVSQRIKNLNDEICRLYSLDVDDSKTSIKDTLIKEESAKASKQAQWYEEEMYTQLEKKSKRILNSALHRFERPYCPERGIHNINFPSEENMRRSVGPDSSFIPLLEQAVGVDLTLVEEKLFLNVSAFDPVRRELTRRIVERMMKEKRLNENRVKDLIKQTKKSLFKKIRSDGIRLAKELRLRGLHPEILNMMGALRYRYSFSQNQHFHCGEVGWLCGLLSAEMGLDLHEGRRAGMLHDIGKSMDHSIDGGHAVIGADFIDKHDEKEHIVHAVRAHHFDETPNSDLAYLVIAADAISGARPGARRSTADNYFQKMNDLERIGNSFKGVNQTFILSAGREIRVMVDAKRFDDYKALQLSKDLASKIEEEMAFPGTIRVTVVRETMAIQYAK